MSRAVLESGPILVVGADGQLGREFVSALAQWGERVVRACRTPGRGDVVIDLEQPQAAAQHIETLEPAVVVNAAAYTAVDRAESESSIARCVNGDGPEAMAAACRESGALFLHFSTDYVFDGGLGRAYRETDATNPVNEYGRSKLLGEQAVAESGVAHLIIRTSGLYTPGGSNFVTTMLRLFRNEKPVGVVGDQRLSPTCARALAEAMVAFLDGLDTERARTLSGLYHVSADGEASWNEFAQAIHERADPAPRAALHSISSEDFGAPASRPACSTLDCRKAHDELGLALPHWLDQLDSVMPEFNQRCMDDTV
jgi:dTDP-4-dehydrorhamnose reductase